MNTFGGDMINTLLNKMLFFIWEYVIYASFHFSLPLTQCGVVLEPNTGDNEDYYRVNAFQMHQAPEFELLHNTQRRNNIYG